MDNSVLKYKSRRLKRLLCRMDSNAYNIDANPKIAYAIAKSMGIDTDDKDPHEVWELIKQKGHSTKGTTKHIKGKHWKKSTKVQNGFNRLGNVEVRRWYVSNASEILNSIDPDLPLEEKAKQAFAKRNAIRTQARDMMIDTDARALLDEAFPNEEFEQLVQSKMKRKGLNREEALEDVIKTSIKTNKEVNRKYGVED